ncbi:WD40/YVTN/BNR-like repeat-containing protein [Alicyclobacillus macrosporangiidus]|uniref:Photosynthesis system II assembly factor Ycf48/Hcf136-like domain-containing protein n=1 Tax=Alicyclobacillus macrosporangiidus TaxID=392015 RepID=A0A1I7HGU5_9BACL|nr:hypothetical protein [Alicyclobacillus macrosporangiidus]SFU59974.1 hypothetical protein SAMN05421543_104189 [Alicyclobacillus macrosporangiidus]
MKSKQFLFTGCVGVFLAILSGCDDGTPVDSITNNLTNTGSVSLSLRTIDMKSTHNGWAVTSDAVMYTTEGGIHWKKVLTIPDGGDIRTDFISADAAAVVVNDQGSDGSSRLFMTSDSGKHWTQSVLPTAGVTDVSFVGSNGWILCDPEGQSMGSEHVTMFHSQDGGKHWVRVAESTGSSSSHQISDAGAKSMVFVHDHVGFVSVQGWIVGLYRTSDSGLQWDRVTLPNLQIPDGMEGGVGKPVFFDASHGVVSSYRTDHHHDWFGAYVTADGGQTWRLQSTVTSTSNPDGMHDEFCFIDQQTWVWVLGDVLWKTSNAGHSWNTITLPFSEVVKLDFVNSKEGWALTRGDEALSTRLFFTEDGGTSWTEIHPQAP